MDTPCPKCDDTGSRIINSPSDWWSEGQLHEACDCPAGVEAKKQWALTLPPLAPLPTPNELIALRQQAAAPCPECHNPDGTLNTDAMDDDSSCTMGCNAQVDSDTGFCPVCREHSANRYECETCGIGYEKWGKEWEVYPADQKARA